MSRLTYTDCPATNASDQLFDAALKAFREQGNEEAGVFYERVEVEERVGVDSFIPTGEYEGIWWFQGWHTARHLEAIEWAILMFTQEDSDVDYTFAEGATLRGENIEVRARIEKE